MGVPVNGSNPKGAIEALAQTIHELVGRMDLPQRLRDAGVRQSDLPELARIAFQNRTVQNNPKPISDVAQLEQLLQAAW
jgi:alcohol dehydrogenase